MQRLRAQRHRGVIEALDLLDPRGLEGEVDGRTNLAVGTVLDPEVRLATAAVTDGGPELHLPGVPQRTEDRVVELLRLAVVGTHDSEVVDHETHRGTKHRHRRRFGQ